MENQLVLKSNIFLTNFISILMTLQLVLLQSLKIKYKVYNPSCS